MSTDQPSNAALAHYGVKGMRWGITKKSSGSGGSASSGKRLQTKVVQKESQDHKTAQKLKLKSLSSMSNKEIQELNRRLQLEKSYRELNPSTSAFKKGKKVGDDILNAGKKSQQVYNLVTSPMGKAIASAVTMAAVTVATRGVYRPSSGMTILR